MSNSCYTVVQKLKTFKIKKQLVSLSKHQLLQGLVIYIKLKKEDEINTNTENQERPL